MSLFKNMKTEGLEESQDRLGGFQPLESDIYEATIKALYAGQSPGGAMSLSVIADVGGKEYRETLWITNKKGENFFMAKDKAGKETGKKSPLPGFTVANDICLIATEKELSEQDTEEKVINVYNFEQKKELPTAVPMITEAIGKKVALGIIKQIVNKNEKQGDEYVPTAESREENLIDKVFHPELKITVAEARKGQKEPAFWDAWLKRNQGQTRDRREIKEGGQAPKAGTKTGAQAPAAGQQRKSLFGK